MEPSAASTTLEERSSLLPTALIAAAVLVVAIIFCASSSWYTTFKAIHVGFAVIWVGGGFLLTVLGLIAERQRDPEQMVAVARQAALVGEKLFTPASAIVLAAGIAMMINLDWGWGHFWIIAGLIGFASTFVTGLGFLAPRAKALHELMQTAGPMAPETQAAIKSILLIARFDMGVLLLVIVDMVTKPFST
jgi:uncharacterized membrane protein